MGNAKKIFESLNESKIPDLFKLPAYKLSNVDVDEIIDYIQGNDDKEKHLEFVRILRDNLNKVLDKFSSPDHEGLVRENVRDEVMDNIEEKFGNRKPEISMFKTYDEFKKAVDEQGGCWIDFGSKSGIPELIYKDDELYYHSKRNLEVPDSGSVKLITVEDLKDIWEKNSK